MLEKLQKLGLTKQEASTYLSLITLQDAKASQISQETGIASSNIYHVLKTLIDKGLASHTTKNNTKYYQPTNIERLNDLLLEKQKIIEEQRKDVTRLIENLQSIPQRTQTNYKYFEGLGGIISMWREITDSLAKENTVFVFASRQEAYEKMIPYYDIFHAKRDKKGIPAKIILPQEDTKLGKRRKNKHTQVRYHHLENNAEIGVVGNYIYIQYVLSNKPIGILIDDEIISNSLLFVLNNFWKNSQD